ncbi:hypothetical protein MF672_026910 [Actinomadura sp. ATCC 31491]|uniref:DUF4231 domain-containing protein n=1 Tax=Actinomadura luzonensis TaxID=2805427 RepID=A0ABT0FYG6_9ACTN|nr:hypothetical protein [Actinomadura luzonensis]MCK2217392.1 hypothetical protein [Actinomadura luzonensis]
MANLLTSGAASLGRLLSVNLLPTALSALAVWIFTVSGSFTGRSHWQALIPTALKADAGTVLLFVVGVVLVSVILEPFQIRLVRMLEGYWSNWTPSARLANVMIARHQQRVQRLRETVRLPLAPREDVRSPLQVRMAARRRYSRQVAARQRAQDRLARYPFVEDDNLLPTALGNALRSGERKAGERYGLDTIHSWPRILPQASPQLAGMANSARDALDANASLCLHFFFVGVLSLIALVDEPLTLWVPAGAFALSVVAYSGAIAAAVAYARILCVVYDLHRFDMVKGLHYKQPESWQEEKILYDSLNTFFRRAEVTYESRRDIGGQVGQPYDHGTDKEDADPNAGKP